ncbi:putative R3H domain protein [Aspergillus clavatus NRRL 1]|uniref:R3H domain protein, putative n=1 Tax=Aspergillus clavatus (strain ATCC 1007 / CBS 513.65 / DSM 816 / NCTC 3887 / NRRL 1 / QM 1276 / 107) TaxID=344612 RepID=A1CQH2_ASPCL|nr:R3H domain protein, putative [Aspergillus clavatus NRRL 1]EAW07893.1 R3H domain protein, putative [Aspergillus clavatus NRRL 1]
MAPPSRSEELASTERDGSQNVEEVSYSEAPEAKSHQSGLEGQSESLGTVNSLDCSMRGIVRAVQDVHLADTKDKDISAFDSEIEEPGALKRETSFEDDRTHLSSSSTKQTSFDSKSVASVTTFAMDEKDSLRPDDSASVQAIDEEEFLSGPASNAPNSLTGSESGARAFRDHLRESTIQRPRPILQNHSSIFSDASQRPNGIPHPELVSNNYVLSNTDGFSVDRSLHGFPLEPDEKLLEAMKSPKDRLLILQLEEKVRHFIQHSKYVGTSRKFHSWLLYLTVGLREQSLELPPSNAFGRLLAHKLGDYYHLTHFVDNNVTSVRLHRTPFCRLPTPLSVLHAATNSTPPPAVPAMKIMRRNDGDRPSNDGSTAASSSVPSKSASELGDNGNDCERGGSSAGATPAKDRLTLTREEREAKYQEARERIFRDFPESKSSDNGDQSVDMSRSSSTSGRKKTHRQKTPHDDSFEARSQFNAYYPGVQYNNGPIPYNAAMNDPSFASQAPYMVGPGVAPPGYAPTAPTGTMYSNHMNLNPLPQYPMPASPQMASAGSWQNSAIPQQSPYSGYASMSQSPVMMAQQSSTKSSPALNNYAIPQHAQAPSTWSSPPYHGGYQSTHRSHAPVHWPNYPSQPPIPSPYPYAQYTGQQPLNPAMQAHSNSHPLPGSFTRSPFNPQTRSFVPGSTPLSRHPSKSGQPSMGMYPSMQPAIHTQWGGLQDLNSKAQEMIGAGPGLMRGPSGSMDSIAKWGTPAHLPPKPPPSEVPSEFEMKHRVPPAPTHPYNGNIAPNLKNGPLVISGGANLPKMS